MNDWDELPPIPGSKRMLEAEAASQGRMAKMRARAGGTVPSRTFRTVSAWVFVVAVIALMTGAILVNVGPLFAAAFLVVAILVSAWLYNQFRGYG